MTGFIKIAIINNEVQAQYLKAVLEDREIPFKIRSYRDSAYDGIFQSQKGWGHVEAPEKYETEIIEIISEIDNASIVDGNTTTN